MYLQWNKDVQLESTWLCLLLNNLAALQFDPLLVNCFEGLTEVLHPQNFIAFNASKQILELEVKDFGLI